MYFFSTLLFSLALSIDGLGVGLAYGLKQIRIPKTSLAIMCSCAMGAILVSMLAGHGIALMLSPVVANRIGAGALITVGCWYLLQSALQDRKKVKEDEKRPEAKAEKIITTVRLRPFNVIIQIMQEPAKADMDSSGSIGPTEALFLGTALALDGLGSGIAAAMADFNILLTGLLVGLCEYVTVSIGLHLGARLPERYFKQHANTLAGLVLCLLGIARLT